MDTGHTDGKKGGAIHRLITILLLIPLALLCSNGYIALYCEEETGYAGTVTLYASRSWEDRNDKILGESVDLNFSFSSKRLYNSEYYEGMISFPEGKRENSYTVMEKRFYPNSLLGRIYNDFKYLFSIGYNYNFYEFSIKDIYDGLDIYISCSPSTDNAYMTIYKDNEMIITYRTDGF